MILLQSRKIRFLSIVFLFLFVLLPCQAKADTGPKPSIVVDFVGLEGERYYVTLLSEEKSTGPWSVADGSGDGMKSDLNEEVYQKFLDYEDVDGFYFLQHYDEGGESQQYIWGYYPPYRFKILLYFPEEDRFLTDNQIYERYAFDSYFTVTAGEQTFTVERTDRTKEKLYMFGREALFLAIRILITLTVELAVAWLFGIRARRQLAIVAVANVVTQILLNVAAFYAYRYLGSIGLALLYLPLELLVFFAENVCYLLLFFRRECAVSKTRVTFYAFVSNACSFGVGVLLANWFPEIM